MKTVIYGDKPLALKPDAFISVGADSVTYKDTFMSDDGRKYEAVAYELNDKGEAVLYKVEWDVYPEILELYELYPDFDDLIEHLPAEDEMCDWDTYTVTPL